MNIELQASDGHRLTAYVANPNGAVTRAVIIIQEIFGLNSHIRSVADGYASDGFLAVAPALFDRVERGVELKYGPEDLQRGYGIATQVGMDNAMRDVSAAVEYATAQVGEEHVAVVGFCWGGSLAWLSAMRLKVAAAVGYYGGRITQYLGEKPRCRVMLHFGLKDPHIPQSAVDTIRTAYPDLPIYLYDAGHGFNCDQRKDYDPQAAALARQRTMDFLEKSLKD